MTRTQRIIISLILRCESGVLLLQRARPFSELNAHHSDIHVGVGVWELPGGGLEFGETPQETGVRETSEETGILVGQENLRLAACCAYTLKGSECESHRVHVIYETNLSAPLNVKHSQEHVTYKWVRDLAAIRDLNMITEIREVISASL
jgi:8-oxo-dGTP diphosphatase